MDNIEKKLEDLGRDAAKIRMTVAEKDAHRAELMRFMEKAVHLPTQKMSVKSWFWSKMNPAYIAAPLAVLGLGTGVVFAAESALPGDFLYPVKTQVIEKVQTSLATTPKAKASLHAQLALERLKELKAINQQRQLQDDEVEELGVHYDENNKNLASALKELKDAHNDVDADEISQKFSQKLNVYRPVLRLIQARRALRKQLQSERDHEPQAVPSQVQVPQQTITPRLPVFTRIRPRLNPPTAIPVVRPPVRTSTHEAEGV